MPKFNEIFGGGSLASVVPNEDDSPSKASRSRPRTRSSSSRGVSGNAADDSAFSSFSFQAFISLSCVIPRGRLAGEGGRKDRVLHAS